MFEIVGLNNLAQSCTNLENELKVQKAEGNRRVLLKGVLVIFKDIGREKKFVTGHIQLFLKDTSAYIHCVVPFRATQMIGQEVLCTKWNFIVQGKDKWLELIDISPCGPLEPEIFSVHLTTQCVVTVHTAVRLWHIRKLLQISSVSVKGCISYVTEITRHKGSVFFLVKVEDSEYSLNILIQDPRLLWWQQGLTLQESYVFTDLVPTSLKACTESCVLYVPTSTSSLHRHPQHDGTLTDYQTFVKERCSELGLGSDKCEELLNYKFMSLSKQTKPLSICTYKGTITDTVNRSLGIYELDHKIRLYTSGCRPVHDYRMLRNGMEITVYNAHHKGYPKPPKIRLCCCEWSCIQIEKIPVYKPEPPRGTEVEDLSNHLLKAHCKTLQQVEWLTETQEKLTEKLAPRIVKPASVCFLLEKILCLINCDEPQNKTDTLLRLLGTHDQCFVIEKQTLLPVCVTMKELCNLGKSLSSSKEANMGVTESFNPSTSSHGEGEQIGWRVIQRDSDRLPGTPVLIGQLKANKKTANIQMVDLTGSMDCVICSNVLAPNDLFRNSELGKTGENETLLNSKGSVCHCLQTNYVPNQFSEICDINCNNFSCSRSSETVAGEGILQNKECDFTRIKDLGQLYMVRKFRFLVEECDRVPGIDDTRGVGVSQEKLQKCYVQFSMEDAIRLSTSSKSDQLKHKDNGQRMNRKIVAKNEQKVCSGERNFHKGQQGESSKCDPESTSCKKQKFNRNAEVAERNDLCIRNCDNMVTKVKAMCIDSEDMNVAANTTDAVVLDCNSKVCTNIHTKDSHCVSLANSVQGSDFCANRTERTMSKTEPNDGTCNPTSHSKLLIENVNTGYGDTHARTKTPVTGTAIDRTSMLSDLDMPVQRVSVHQPFILLHKDSLQVKRQATQQPKVVFYALVCFICKPYTVTDSDFSSKQQQNPSCSTDLIDRSSQSTSTSKRDVSSHETIRQVALVLEESSVKWYHVLHVGQLYILCKERCRDIDVFQPKCSSQILKKAMLKSGAKMLLPVEETMKIKEQSTETFPKGCLKDAMAILTSDSLLPQVHTVTQLLQHNCEEKLVSVCGVITGRRHVDRYRDTHKYSSHRQVTQVMYKLGALIPENYTIELTLGDLNTDATIRIFMNPETHLYQVGLLSGTQVLLYKLELKRSGGGSLYCQYLSASSCRIISSLPEDWRSQHHNEPEHQTVSGSCGHISDVLFGHSGQTLIFPTIQKVLKLSLKYICSRCSLVAKPSDADSFICHCGNTHFLVNSQASVLIDDGTCNAMVYCSGDIVWKLLALNKDQEIAVEALVRKQGLIVIDQGANEESVAHLFLNALLSSTHVKRRVSLKVRARGKFFGSLRKSYQDLNLSDVMMKKVQVGDGELHSYCLPLPQLDCVEFLPIDCTAMSKLLLYSNT